MKILLLVYDNQSYISTFPHGLAYIAAVLQKNGHKVEIYNQDQHHYPSEHLTKYLDTYYYDIVGINIIGGYWQYKQLLLLSEAINKSKNRHSFKYILGGHGVSPEPQYFLNKTKCDVIVIGEGEDTIIDLIEALMGFRSLRNVLGIVYREENETFINPRRLLIQNIDNIPFPAWDLFPIEYYRLLRYVNMNSTDFLMPVLSSRGCPFKCNFCYRYDEGFRPRKPESIIDEIKLLKEKYRINVIDFSDELLMASVSRTIELCEAFIKSGLKFKWHCNGRLNFAKSEVLELMKKAGCIFINYGIEAIDNKVLEDMHKALTVEQIIKGVENTLEIGISPGLNIIFGHKGDSQLTLNKAVNFLLKYDDCAQLRTIRPTTPYPGSELYYDAIKMGKLKGVEDFYENKHKNSDLLAVNFTNLTDKDFHIALYNANRILIQNYFDKHFDAIDKQMYNLYYKNNIDFRGFRQF